MTVLVKIITVGSAVVVKSELQKQECVVGDVSGCCRIVLWNDDQGFIQDFKLGGGNPCFVEARQTREVWGHAPPENF